MLCDFTNCWKAFSAFCGCGSIFPERSYQDAWKSCSYLARGQVNIADEAKLCSPIHSTFEVLVKQRAADVVENWVLSVNQCQLQVLQFSVHLFQFLSILLRCNGFTGIQKAVVDQTTSRPPNSDYDLFLVYVWLWEVLWNFSSVQPQSWSSPVTV